MLKENRSDRVPKGVSKRVIQLISLFINMRPYNINSGNRIHMQITIALDAMCDWQAGNSLKNQTAKRDRNNYHSSIEYQ